MSQAHYTLVLVAYDWGESPCAVNLVLRHATDVVPLGGVIWLWPLVAFIRSDWLA